MRFFLVARDPGTGAVRLINEGTFALRQDALDVLGPAVDADDSLVGSELFLVDLDQITPVVLYRTPAPAICPEEPLADAWITPVDVSVADAVVEEAVLEGSEPLWVPDETLAVPTSDDGDLADALRRAASRLESEGIVAPPSVEEFAMQSAIEPATVAAPSESVVAESEPWPWESPDAGDLEEADAEVGESAEAQTDAEVAESTETAEAAVTPAEETSADAPVEPGADPDTVTPAEAVVDVEVALAIDVPVPEDAGARDEPGVFELVGIDEAGLEDVQLLTPVGDLAPHPLIVGEYAPSATVDADDLTLSEIEALASGLGDSPGDVGEDALDGGPAVVEAETVEPVTDTAITENVAASEERAYEPGALDIAAYTCDDCVYVDTCPKARQDGPATCGSFQWKSV
jgi:hypothetical protein